MRDVQLEELCVGRNVKKKRRDCDHKPWRGYGGYRGGEQWEGDLKLNDVRRKFSTAQIIKSNKGGGKGLRRAWGRCTKNLVESSRDQGRVNHKDGTWRRKELWHG